MWQPSFGVLTNVALQGSSAPATDPNFATVENLFGWEGTDGTNTPITEESNAARTGAASGGAQYDTAQFKFGTSSLLLDGVGDRVSFGDSTAYDFAADFTIECWFKVNAISGNDYLICKDTGTNGVKSWAMGFNADGSLFGYISLNGTALITLTTTTGLISADGNWHHLVFHRASDVLRLHFDGVLQAGPTTQTGATFNSTAALMFGARSDGTVAFFDGWIDEHRINSAHDYYPSDSTFAVPTAPFPRS